MPTLLKIGYDYYLVKSEAQAAKCVTALAGVVKLRRNYEATARDEFYPEGRQDEIGLLTVGSDQILRAKPGEVVVEVIPARRQLKQG